MDHDLKQPDTTHPKYTPANRRHTGAAMRWLLLVVVVLAILGASALWGPGRGGPDPADPNANAPAPADLQAINTELEALGDLFGQVIENQRDPQPVIERIDKLLASHPDSAEAHMLRSQALLYDGQSEEALLALQASLKLKPRQAKAHRLAGNLAMKLQQYEDARHHYEQAMTIEPGNGESAVFLANIQLKLNENDQAAATLLTALRRNSELHSAYALLSDVYAKKNKLQLALDQAHRAIETAPTDNPNLRTAYTLKRAALLRRNNQPAESLAVLEALPADARLETNVLRDTATCWAMLGKPAMAAELYERVLKVDPSSDLAAAQAASWRIKAGDMDAARSHVQTLRRINPRHDALIELERKLNEPIEPPSP